MTGVAQVSGLLPGPDLSRVLAEPLALLHREVGLDLWLVTRREGAHLRVLAAEGPGMPAGTTVRWDDTLCARMLRDEGPRCAPRCADVPAYAAAPLRHRAGVGAYIGAPIGEAAGPVTGSLCGLAAAEQPDRLALALPLVEQMAALIGVVLAQNDAVQEWRAVADLAERDAVTGLVDRAGWDRAVAVERARDVRSTLPAGGLIADHGGAKRVTDVPGHGAGDAHLRPAGRAPLSACRPEDVVARVGGDEFAVLAPATELEAAEALGRHLGILVRSQLAVSLSVGVALSREGEPDHELIARADAAVYAVKHAGRDGVAFG